MAAGSKTVNLRDRGGGRREPLLQDGEVAQIAVVDDGVELAVIMHALWKNDCDFDCAGHGVATAIRVRLFRDQAGP